MAVIDPHAQKHRFCCCLVGVGMHGADHLEAGVLPIAVHGSVELLAKSKAQPSSNAPPISNVQSVQSC